MTWNYKPNPKTVEKFLFDGPYYVTSNVDSALSREDVIKGIDQVISAAQELGGLDKIQILTHSTNGKIIWIVDNLSEEHKEEIEESSPTPENDIQDSDGTTVMFPEDY